MFCFLFSSFFLFLSFILSSRHIVFSTNSLKRIHCVCFVFDFNTFYRNSEFCTNDESSVRYANERSLKIKRNQFRLFASLLKSFVLMLLSKIRLIFFFLLFTVNHLSSCCLTLFCFSFSLSLYLHISTTRSISFAVESVSTSAVPKELSNRQHQQELCD